MCNRKTTTERDRTMERGQGRGTTEHPDICPTYTTHIHPHFCCETLSKKRSCTFPSTVGITKKRGGGNQRKRKDRLKTKLLFFAARNTSSTAEEDKNAFTKRKGGEATKTQHSVSQSLPGACGRITLTPGLRCTHTSLPHTVARVRGSRMC